MFLGGKKKMRNKKTHSLAIKKKLSKSEKMFTAYSELQLKYGEELDKKDDIDEIKFNYLLSDFVLGDSYTTDFVCVKSNGELMVRECVLKKNLLRPSVLKILDCSRNYWFERGVTDWGLVVDE